MRSANSNHRAWSGRVIIGFLLTLAGCSDMPTERVGELTPGDVQLEIVSGNTQTAPAGTELPSPTVVRVTNSSGQGVAGQIVNFRVTEGGGSVFAGTALTNAQGIAQERWTLGTTPGVTQKLEARAVDAATGEKRVFATFTATAADPATTVTSVAVSPTASNMTVGGTLQLAAQAKNASGSNLTGKSFTWSSTNTTVATVSSAGVVTARAAGTATIRAVSEGQTGSATVTITAASVAKDTIPPGNAGRPTVTVTAVNSTSFRVSATWGAATDAAKYNWSAGSNAGGYSTNGSVTSTSVTFTAQLVPNHNRYWFCVGAEDAAGNTSVQLSCNIFDPPAAAEPVTATVSSVVTSPASANLQVGATQQLSASARDASGNAISGKTFTWSSSNTAIATVSSSGLVTAVAAGTVTIKATVDGRSGTSTITVTAVASSPAKPPAVGSGEPTYSSAQHALVLQDDFNRYTTWAAVQNAYPVGRGTEFGELTTGRTGNAVRLKYGIGAAEDIIFGPETRLGAVGRWNGTLPEKRGPYTHFFFTTWFRTSPGANPTQNDASGIKGFMFWHTNNQRYQNAINSLSQSGGARGPKGANPDNAQTGLNLYKTADGKAPLWSTYADGNWHRFTIEIYAGNDPSGLRGESYWVDGQLIYSDVGINVAGGKAGHYDYAYPVTHWMVFGNFVNGSARSGFFTIDFDDWMAWTTK